jgi:transcriptional regulator with XRE-family HTH domain
MVLIGTKLRELRQQRNMTLRQVADGTGFTVSYLSQLERDKVSISVDNLERLAQFYEVHMVHFFRGAEAIPIQVTHFEEIQENLAAFDPGPAVVTLLANRADSRIEPMLIRIQPGQEEPHFRASGADILVFILEGRAIVLSETGEEIELNKGDLAYYINAPRRRMINNSRAEPLDFLIVTAPPTSSLGELVNVTQGQMDIKGE